ncbi:ribonuclease P [Streptococcus sp. HMSC062D07]|uniref:ribonuclease P n=1 Tax=Streptococcus sp. HMSC062D07 TaxID=1739461 RepID=UPI0008A4B1CE|nr:ribonuclease P [Streptococcus sp. HMSC062D07]OFQ04393.1 ribonuclease P [Streptococcus sp. HMSC062D07]
MLNKIRDYLDFAGLQYRNPDKAGEEREKMMTFRNKGQEARKAFTELAKAFQASHPEWQLQQTSQWMNQAQRLRPHFWVYLQREGHVTEPMMALRLYGNQNNWGISIEVSFIERKKDEATLSKQAKILDVPVVDGIYYWVQKNDESYRVQATEENRQLLRQQLSNQEIRKVLVKVDIPVADEDTIDKLLDKLDRGFEKLSSYYQVTRD